MNAALKEELRCLCTLIDAAGTLAEIEDMALAARLDLAKFLMYLSSSDGLLRPEEAELISQVLDFTMDTEQINAFIKEHNVYSSGFESSCPPVFALLVTLDNGFYSAGDRSRRPTSERLFRLYQALGAELLGVDGAAAGNEKTDFGIYIRMLDQFLNNNLLSRK